MLMTLREPDLEELQIPAWSGDRTRLLNAIAQLKANAAAVANGERAPPLAQPQVAAAPVGGPPPDERSMNSPAGQWLVSAGFGRLRGLLGQAGVYELSDVAELEREDLVAMGVTDAGGQLGRLQAAISGLRCRGLLWVSHVGCNGLVLCWLGRLGWVGCGGCVGWFRMLAVRGLCWIGCALCVGLVLLDAWPALTCVAGRYTLNAGRAMERGMHRGGLGGGGDDDRQSRWETETGRSGVVCDALMPRTDANACSP